MQEKPSETKITTPPQAPTYSREEVVKRLNGRTLMIYFVLLNKGQIGVRELQRHLNLSSPSVARYHLEKLSELFLVENRNGRYFLIKKADLPVLTSWILIGARLLPKVLFAAVFFTILFLGYMILSFSFWNKDSAFVILFGCLILAYTWVDVVIQLKNKPI
ncbi:MAG: hypothetical protein ACTSWW_05480 [Promethearchaeota archaeon]